MRIKPAVSIIIPVYNVVEYVDQCLESVISQTFKDYEVILINDGSTDGSEKKCEEWAKKDSRIRYITKENEGLYKTWNRGIDIASGEYLAFIDSDDWVSSTYLEKLYKKAIETNADMVECDFWRYNNNTGEKTIRTCYGKFGKDYTCEEHMIYGESTLWKYISKRELWDKNNMYVPECRGSSHVVYFLFLALGAEITSVKEPLYYYRRLRKGSIIETNGDGTDEARKIGLKELDILEKELGRRHLYPKWKNVFERTVKYRLSDFLAGSYLRRDGEEYLVQENEYYKYISEKFPESFNDRYITLGGYNLNRILSYLPNIHSPYCRFNFSSLISIINPVIGLEIQSNNYYRSKMIHRDVESRFWEVLEQEKPEYIFIDFIEERFDVLQLKEGGCITLSEAIHPIDEVMEKGRVISRNSIECENMWKKSWDVFLEQLKRIIDEKKIIIIENYLSSYVGTIDYKRKYDNAEEIEEKNRILNIYYEYVKEKNPEICVLDVYKNDYYYTDENYEHGAIPSHLNDYVNRIIAKQVVDALGLFKKE